MMDLESRRTGMNHRSRGLPVSLLLSSALALGSAAGHGALRISEFMAENDGGLRDSDGETPDWIEIQNDSGTPVNLAGWHLTDSPTNLTRWTFPATNLAASGYLVVFASGKDRAIAGAELHTNFQLDNNGEYLALVAPDGVTVAHAYSPLFPPQRANVSFGAERQTMVTPLIRAGAPARIQVPADGSLGDAWTGPGFDDSSWTAGATGVGFDGNAPGGSTNAADMVVLNLDFNDDDSGETGAANTETGFSTMTLSSNPSTFNGITVTLSALGGSTLDDRDRAIPVDSTPNFTQDQLYDDFVFAAGQTNGNGLRIRLTGLPPNQDYSVTIWSYDSSSAGSRVSDWIETAGGVTNVIITGYAFDGSLVPTQDGQDTFGGFVRSSSDGALQIEGRRSGGTSHGVFLNALRLVQLGYGSLIATDVGPAMSNRNASAFVRIPFVVDAPDTMQTLTLRMKYDDGFLAYLNGALVASRNAPGSPQWNSAATAAHPNAEAVVYEEMSFPNYGGLMFSGTNLLAIHGLNLSATDADFLILPELDGITVTETAGRYLKPPTPGGPNGPGYPGFVADTEFSVDRGFYDVPFTVAITTATAGAEIRWTTNGSAPTAAAGTAYSGPLLITNTTFLRAAAFLPGYLPSDVDTHTYIFLNQVLRQPASLPGYPTTWQASYPADYAMDPAVVTSTNYGRTLSNDLRSVPSLCLVLDHNGLWNSSTGIYVNSTSIGPAWERAASVELIAGSGQSEFATTCKIQIHGNASRDNVRTPKHSLGLNFNSDYGPANLRYDWFGGGVAVHDQIVLRACGFVDGWAGRYADDGLYTSTETGEVFRGLRYRPENTCYLRDAWVKDSFRAMGWSASRSQYVHLYLNGLYWGLYEPSEHLDAAYFSRLYGGPENAWDVLVGEDNNGPPVIVDGSGVDWTNVLNLVNAGVANEAAYQALGQLVDLDNLIDYMIVHIFAESEDWPRHNWYMAHRRARNGLPATKFICSVWDQELTLDRLVRRNRIDVGNSGGEVYGPGRVYAQLRAWPEFRRQFGDRVQKHLFNGGALTPSNNVARLLTPAGLIHDALVGESARWGDARKNPTPGNTYGTGQTFTRDEWWQPEIDKLATNFFRTLTITNVARFRAGSLFPALAAPDFNQFGGGVPAGFGMVLTHTNASGTIFFTTDGADPRTYGTGAVGPSAQAYDAPVTLNAPTLVRARVLSGGQWSALVEAMFYPPQDLSRLALTEIMFNPPGLGTTNGDEFEFIELKNTGTNTLNLSGLTFTTGITFTFTNGTRLAPGAFLVLVHNAAAFASRYPGVPIDGVFSGKLDNGGEVVTLSHALGPTVWSVSYDDTAPWPATADNLGFSLVQKSGGATQAPDDGSQWRASAHPGGSPGADDPPPGIPPIVINEILTASVPPQLDTIELFNPTVDEADVGGWFLTDDPKVPQKFCLPDGSRIPASGYLVFDEMQFNPTPGLGTSFSLSSRGEQVYLFSADAAGHLTGYNHGFRFEAAEPGVSFGRHVTSDGEEHFPAQRATSFTNDNAGPRVGPVVINEIHYHPPVAADARRLASGPDFRRGLLTSAAPLAVGDEFVELRNLTGRPVLLFDPTDLTSTWRLNGLGYVFPTNAGIEPNGLLLLVATNPVDFRVKYSVPTNVLVLGPYPGALQDSGERLSLEQPAPPDTNGPAWIVVDEVRYNDRAPWPPAADGSGPSLQRLDSSAYGDDPINWAAAPPTPGLPNSFPELDTDGDGLPDAWELANGTNPYLADAGVDPDHDGYTNGDEYLAGTNPLDAQSRLQVDRITVAADTVMLEFLAISNRTYHVLGSDGLGAMDWTPVADVPARPTNRWAQVTELLAAGTNRFYRLVIPAAP